MKFVTMANRDYLPGVKTLFTSIEQNGKLSEMNFTVICIDDLTTPDAPELSDLDTNVNFINASELGDFEYNRDILKRDYKYINQNKFLIYKLPYDEPVCYVDADMLCLNDISAIESFDPFSACINLGGDPPYPIKERPMFNSGFFIFQPSEETFRDIQEFVTNFDKMTKFGDQRLFNEYMYTERGSDVNILSLDWNVTITVKHYRPDLWDFVESEGIKFLHYTTIKPWESPNFSDGVHRYYVDKRRQFRYRNEIKMWEDYYSS